MTHIKIDRLNTFKHISYDCVFPQQMIASTIKIIRIIFSIIHQIIPTASSTYTIRSRPNHLPFTYQMIKFAIKPSTAERDHIIPSLIRLSDALPPQKPLIHFETSVSITHFSLSAPATHFFAYIISLLLSLLFLLFFSLHTTPYAKHLRYFAFVLCFCFCSVLLAQYQIDASFALYFYPNTKLMPCVSFFESVFPW